MSDLNKIGTYEYVSRDTMLARTRTRLGLRETSDVNLLLLDMINEGVKELRNMGTLIPGVAQLPIEGHKACLPTGFARFTKKWPIVFVDSEGNANTSGNAWCVPQFVNNTFFENSPFNDANGVLTNCWYTGTVNIIGGYLCFSTNVDAGYCKISFIGANLDCNGQVLIPAIAERTIREYVMGEYKSMHEEKYSQMSIMNHRQRWSSGKAYLKGFFNLPDSLQYQGISRTMASLY